jgi:hypothetical protein
VPVIRHVRARLASYAIALALCQVAAVGSATIVLAASPQSRALTVAADDECSCEHTTGVMCPMHRKSSSRPVPANAPRWCQGVDDSTAAVLPVLGALALPERVARFTIPVVSSLAPPLRVEAPRPLHSPPDSPPPRL